MGTLITLFFCIVMLFIDALLNGKWSDARDTGCLLTMIVMIITWPAIILWALIK